MSNKVRINISLNEEIYNKGKENAEKMGIPFSSYLSILISNDNRKEKK